MFNFNEIMSKLNIRMDYVYKELSYSEVNAQPFFRLVKEYYKEKGKEISNSEISRDFSNFFIELNKSIAKLPTIKSDTLRYYAVKELLEEPSLIKKYYNEIIEDEKENPDRKIDLSLPYNSNKNISMKTAVYQALYELRDIQAQRSPEEIKEIQAYLRLPRKAQNQFKRGKDIETRKYLEYIDDYFRGTELERVEGYLKRAVPNLEEMLKEKLIKSMTFLGEQFNELDLLDSYAFMQDKMLNSMGLSNIAYPLERVKDSKKAQNQIAVKDIFDSEFLKGKDLKTLYLLNAFWLNRYTKELKNMNATQFVIDSLNLWDEINKANPDPKTGIIHIDINSKDLENLYKKMAFLKIVSDQIMDEIIKNPKYKCEKVKIEGNDGESSYVKRYDTKDIIFSVNENLGQEYSEEFEKLLPSIPHNFKRDLDNFRVIENSKFNIYKLKDYTIIATLASLYDRKDSKNWGIILNKNRKVGKGKKILIGVDYKGLNMPIRLHIDKLVVRDFIKANQGTTFFPIYEGADDFEYLGRNIPTHVLLPMSKEYIEELKKASEKNQTFSCKKKFLNHLEYLAGFSNFPEHLKIDRVDRKKHKIKKSIPVKEYVDLDENDDVIYVKDNKGEMIVAPKQKAYKEKSEK